MISNKRYFRKLHNKIYLLICTIIITTLILINGYINNINEILNSYYRDHSVLLMITKDDVEDKINKYNGVYQVDSNLLIFTPDEDNNTTLTHQGYILKSDDKVLDEQETDNSKLAWEDFELLNKLVVTYDNELVGNEAILSSSFSLDEDIINSTLNKSLNVLYENTKYAFTIKSIEKSQYSKIKISKELYDELYKYKSTYTYIISFNSTKYLNEFYNEAKELFNPVYRDAQIEQNTDYYGYQEIINIYNDWKYIIYVIVLIILFVITLNMTLDEKKDISIDYMLGYNKTKIKINLLINNIIFSFFVAIISIILCFILSNSINIGLNIYDVLIYIITLIIMFIINVITLKIKLDG